MEIVLFRELATFFRVPRSPVAGVHGQEVGSEGIAIGA